MLHGASSASNLPPARSDAIRRSGGSPLRGYVSSGEVAANRFSKPVY
jgi:hypothetical protein